MVEQRAHRCRASDAFAFHEVCGRAGVALVPDGRRRRSPVAAFSRLLGEDLENRVLPFYSQAALQEASLAADRRRAGRSVDIRDTQIAGIAKARRAAVATRFVRHFEGMTVPVIKPWA